MVEFIVDYLVPSFCAFLACIGFCFVFNIHGLGMVIGSLGGGLAWLVYLLCGSSIMAGFFAAMAVGAWLCSKDEPILGRKRKQNNSCKLSNKIKN